MYTRSDANNELISRMDKCMETRDVEEAYKLCEILAQLGDDENAHAFRMMAVRWEKEDNYHDAVNGN